MSRTPGNNERTMLTMIGMRRRRRLFDNKKIALAYHLSFFILLLLALLVYNNKNNIFVSGGSSAAPNLGFLTTTATTTRTTKRIQSKTVTNTNVESRRSLETNVSSSSSSWRRIASSGWSAGPAQKERTTTATSHGDRRHRNLSFFKLYMGRAAAVRASTKAKTDAKKTKTNAIFGKRIIMAVKSGGPDPTSNRALADVIKQAKSNNVPVDNINRAIKRASETSTDDYKEITFEAYGFGGVSFIINVLTDNNNRATADVKSLINKRDGCKIAESGSVLFMYDRKAKIEVQAELDEETILDAAIDAGCDDLEFIPPSSDDDDSDDDAVDKVSIIYTDPKEASLMLEAVRRLGYDSDDSNDSSIVKMSLVHVSKAPIECNEDDFEQNMSIIDALEELDDVDNVEHNMSN